MSLLSELAGLAHMYFRGDYPLFVRQGNAIPTRLDMMNKK